MNIPIKAAGPASAMEQAAHADAPCVHQAGDTASDELAGDDLAKITGGTGKRILPEMVNAG